MRSPARRAAAPKIALLVVAMMTLATLAGLIAAAPAAAAPSLMPPQVVVGASAAIDSVNGLAIADDGSGGLVFLETVGGVPHVYVSRLEQGVWQPPEQVDSGLAGASSQPVIAAHDHGELIVAFVNAGAVYVSTAKSRKKPFSTLEIAAGAANPSISVNSFGVGYLAYTAQDGAGDDVDVEYFTRWRWLPADPQAVNATAADNAGTGAGAPDVVAAGDGVGIVTWGENGHIYSRRVWGTATSVQIQQLDPPSVAGWGEVTADTPQISAGGDSSYPVIVFRETITDAGEVQSRVLATRLVAETAWSPVTVDDLTVGSEEASQPRVAMNDSGAGFVTAATGTTDQLIATPVANYGYVETPAPLAPGGGINLPYAVPTDSGRGDVIAWQVTPATGSPQILASYAPKGGHLRAPMTVSAAANGPTDAAQGLLVAGDDHGDAAIAWVQGVPGALSIDAAELIARPLATGPRKPLAYTNRSAPELHWPASPGSWGGIRYAVRLDGSVLGSTRSLKWQLRRRLADGRHIWELTSTNEASKSTVGLAQTLFVDTQPPVLHARLSGRPRVGRTIRIVLHYTDPPKRSQPHSRASGIASEKVKWGDGTVTINQARRKQVKRVKHGHGHRVYYTVTVTHVYRRSGRRTVRATVTDRAGNATTVTRKLLINPVPKRRTKSRH